MAEDQNNGLALKSSSGYTGKLFLPSTADIATLNTAQAAVNSIDPTARFIVSSTEPETVDDGKIWITVEGGGICTEYLTGGTFGSLYAPIDIQSWMYTEDPDDGSTITNGIITDLSLDIPSWIFYGYRRETDGSISSSTPLSCPEYPVVFGMQFYTSNDPNALNMRNDYDTDFDETMYQLCTPLPITDASFKFSLQGYDVMTSVNIDCSSLFNVSIGSGLSYSYFDSDTLNTTEYQVLYGSTDPGVLVSTSEALESIYGGFPMFTDIPEGTMSVHLSFPTLYIDSEWGITVICRLYALWKVLGGSLGYRKYVKPTMTWAGTLCPSSK